jgi:hypothetical protein
LRDKRLRAEFGLDSSSLKVQESFADRARHSDLNWGVPLTPAEAEELYERVRIVERAVPILKEVARRSDYAGAYYDQLRGGIPVILVSKNRSAAESAITDLAGSLKVDVKKVDRSWSKLKSLKASVKGRDAELRARSVQLVSVAIDTPQNRVEVAVDGDVAAARDILSPLGDGVHVVSSQPAQLDVCDSANNCPAAKAGIRLNGNTSYCTTGFVGQRTDGTDHLVVMTAGHCWQFAQSNNTSWEHNDQLVGTSEQRVWNSSSSAPYPEIPSDVGIVDLASGFIPGAANKILTANANPTVELINRVATGAAWHIVGTPVCRMGAGSANTPGYPAKKCGTVIAVQDDSLSCKGPGSQPPCATVLDGWR